MENIETVPMETTEPAKKVTQLAENALVDWDMLYAELSSSPSIPEDLDLEDPEVKDILIKLINTISSQAEAVIGRHLGKKTYTERFTTGTSNVVNLRNSPIRELDEVALVNGAGEKMIHKLDSDLIKSLNEYSDLKVGSIYLDTMYLPSSILVGLGQYRGGPKRNMLIKYVAGYVLPHQQTDEQPCDLPAAISGIVLDVARREFENRIDPNRAGDLIQLQEGNISRMWGTGTQQELVRSGYFTIGEQKILKTYSNDRAIYSV